MGTTGIRAGAMVDRKQVFVAYPGRDKTLSAGIMDAVRKANALPLPVQFVPWAFNDVAGNQLVSPIQEKIDEAPFVIADITYLNPNVVYEIGLTIGKGKRAFLIRYKQIDGEKRPSQICWYLRHPRLPRIRRLRGSTAPS